MRTQGTHHQSRIGIRLTLGLSILLTAAASAHGVEEFRSIDGTGNSNWNWRMGAAGMPLMRFSSHAYADHKSTPAGAQRPSARQISNAVCAESSVRLNDAGASDYLWLWGQFVDHDIDLTPEASPAEPFDIEIPMGDPWFDPGRTGAARMLMSRSIYDPSTGTRATNPRRQLSMITGWLDGSNVYGSDAERADALRANKGRGRLRTSRGRLLPFNTAGLDNAGGTSAALFLAGDIRANEQASLTAMHTLWVREHNRIARDLGRRYPRMNGDEIYERARAKVGALVQAITYREFLPLLLGRDAVPEYEGWDPFVDATISQEFSTAAYRFGHSMVSEQLLRLRRNLHPIRQGNLPLRDAFFAPEEIRATGIDPILRGLAYQRARQADLTIVDSLRNFLFGPPGAGGFDLAALNIQRGRDHGLEDLNAIRRTFGLRPYYEFDEITSDPDLARTLEDLYGDIEDVDLWVGGLAEDHVADSFVGETFWTIIRDQFLRLRDGDRFWYERVFSGAELREIQATRLADVIRRNTRIRREIPDDVFLVPRR